MNIWPRPIQQPKPPIHIPGGGSVETYDFCIDNTYSYSYLSFSGYLRAKALMDGYWRRVDERGAPDKSPYRAGFAQTICVGGDGRGGREALRRARLYFYNRCLHVYPGLRRCAGLPHHQDDPDRRAQQYAPPTGGYTQLTWKELTEQGHVIAGSTGDRAPAYGGSEPRR